MSPTLCLCTPYKRRQRLDVGFGVSDVEEASTALSPLQSYYYFCKLCYFFNKK